MKGSPLRNCKWPMAGQSLSGLARCWLCIQTIGRKQRHFPFVTLVQTERETMASRVRAEQAGRHCRAARITSVRTSSPDVVAVIVIDPKREQQKERSPSTSL